MKIKSTFKCLHCSELHRCDARNRGRQQYCGKPECKRTSKAASQRKWNAQAENKNYFSGESNCERVRQWRKAHPGYWRKKRPAAEDALQDSCPVQVAAVEEVIPQSVLSALQDASLMQPALLVGLVSMMTGHALQEDIALSLQAFKMRGRGILDMKPEDPLSQIYEKQTYFATG